MSNARGSTNSDTRSTKVASGSSVRSNEIEQRGPVEIIFVRLRLERHGNVAGDGVTPAEREVPSEELVGIEWRNLVFEEISSPGVHVRLDEDFIDRLDDRVQPPIFTIDCESRVGLARHADAHLLEHSERELLTQEGGVVVHVIDHERLEAVEALRGDLPIEVDAETGLDAIARTAAARADGGVGDGLTIERDRGVVPRVLLVGRSQPRPVGGGHRDLHVVQPRGVEESIESRVGVCRDGDEDCCRDCGQDFHRFTTGAKSTWTTLGATPRFCVIAALALKIDGVRQLAAA